VLQLLGHDSGSCVAGFCVLVRPGLFEHFMLISEPLHGRPIARYHRRAEESPALRSRLSRVGVLGALRRSREDYGTLCAYYSTAEGNADVYGHEEPERFLRRSVPVRLSSR